MSNEPYFDESLYRFVVILLDIILSGTFGVMIAVLIASNRLIKHNSNNTGKAFKDNCSNKLVSYDHHASQEFWGQTPEMYEKRCKANKEQLQEANQKFFEENVV